MNQETAIYLTNIVIGTILAALATRYWRQRKNAASMPYWVLGAWVMTLADILFAARPYVIYELGRTLPPLSVTVGHAVLLMGARRTAGLPSNWGVAGAAIAVHGLGLIGFLFIEPGNMRMVFNGLVWGGFSLASGWCLRRGSVHFWKSLAAPASVFFAHGIFHALRVGLAVLFHTYGWTEASQWLQIIGDLEVSFFMVALFTGLLLAHLQVHHDELMSARAEVQTLSGLLPICAWCKKVRDDNGYWEQVEDYFGSRSSIKFTHGMCVDCVSQMKVTQSLTS